MQHVSPTVEKKTRGLYTIRGYIFWRRHSIQCIQETANRMNEQSRRREISTTHKPAISSGRIFSISMMFLMVGSAQSFIISSAQACRITPGSSGSNQLIKSMLSQLSRPPLLRSRRLKAFFQPVLELTLISWGNGRPVRLERVKPST